MRNSEIKKTVVLVYRALSKHGYRPVDQIVGYILTGDPTYITNCDGARRLISKIERDDLLADILIDYFA